MDIGPTNTLKLVNCFHFQVMPTIKHFMITNLNYMHSDPFTVLIELLGMWGKFSY